MSATMKPTTMDISTITVTAKKLKRMNSCSTSNSHWSPVYGCLQKQEPPPQTPLSAMHPGLQSPEVSVTLGAAGACTSFSAALGGSLEVVVVGQSDDTSSILISADVTAPIPSRSDNTDVISSFKSLLLHSFSLTLSGDTVSVPPSGTTIVAVTMTEPGESSNVTSESFTPASAARTTRSDRSNPARSFSSDWSNE